jgi:DNA polymerase-4
MILHIDMDAFFASVEQLDRPELRGKCIIVGGNSNRGVVTTASYEARRYGVRSAMPMFEARRRCPHAIIVPGRMARYKRFRARSWICCATLPPMSNRYRLMRPIWISAMAIDLFGPPELVARRIKEKVLQTTGLTCSIGAAPLRFLAKIASDLEKPDGLTIIRRKTCPAFIEQLPVRKIPGVGRVTHEQLTKMGLKTLGDVRRYPHDMLINRLGKFGHRLIALSRGDDPTPVTPHTAAKSVSSESTLAQDTMDRSVLQNLLLHHAEDVGRQLRQLNVKARTISLKIKHADFHQITRSKTLDRPVQADELIFRQAAHLFEAYPLRQKVRLIGVGAATFIAATTPVQTELFPEKNAAASNWEKVDHTVDAINAKFGRGLISKASLVMPENSANRAPGHLSED